MSTWLRRLAAYVFRRNLDDELADEIRLHIELRRQALIDDGRDPREAEYEARRMFGNAALTREEARDLWGFRSLDTLHQDVRFAIDSRASRQITLAVDRPSTNCASVNVSLREYLVDRAGPSQIGRPLRGRERRRLQSQQLKRR